MSMMLACTEIIWQWVAWPVAAYRILSRRTWTEDLCLHAAHFAAFLSEATTPPRCPACTERLCDAPNPQDAQGATAAPQRARHPTRRRRG